MLVAAHKSAPAGNDTGDAPAATDVNSEGADESYFTFPEDDPVSDDISDYEDNDEGDIAEEREALLQKLKKSLEALENRIRETLTTKDDLKCIKKCIKNVDSVTAAGTETFKRKLFNLGLEDTAAVKSGKKKTSSTNVAVKSGKKKTSSTYGRKPKALSQRTQLDVRDEEEVVFHTLPIPKTKRSGKFTL